MTIKTTNFTHRPCALLARFSFCWWRHNRLLLTSQWPDNCDAITWIVISNSFTVILTTGRVKTNNCVYTQASISLCCRSPASPRLVPMYLRPSPSPAGGTGDKNDLAKLDSWQPFINEFLAIYCCEIDYRHWSSWFARVSLNIKISFF